MSTSHEEIRRLYCEDKLSLTEIGRQFSCHRDTIRNLLIRQNVPIRSRAEAMKLATKYGVFDKLKSTPNLRLNVEAIKRLYLEEGLGMSAIAKKFGSTIGSIDNFMKHNGIPSRTRKEAGKLRRGENSTRWKGGRSVSTNGYVRISKSLLSNKERELFKPMLDARHYSMIQEHRVIVARFLGRPLKEDEVVHHFNGIKHDNRLENLVLMKNSEHQKYIPALKKRIRELEKQIRELEIEKQLHLELTGG